MYRAKNRNNKICFIHVSKEGNFPNIKLLPLGLIAIADYLLKNGYNSTIVHLGLEKVLDPLFDLKEYIYKNRYSVVLFDLHWHYQAYHVIKTIKDLKRNMKNLKIIIGGFTASFFSDDIMKRYKEIDFVIRGDPEIPLLKLLKCLQKSKTNFLDVSNLSWRRGKNVIHNSQEYVINKEIIDNLCFTNFKLVRNYKQYIEKFSTGPGKYDNTPIFYYVPGRGCTVNCSFCGGSLVAQKIINNRKSIIRISIKSVIRDLKSLDKYNITKVNICFDPLPKDKYYILLFREIKRNKIKLCMDFECFGLPSKEFIDAFLETFNNASSITISPESGAENIRRKNKGMYYSNDKLKKTLLYLDEKNIKIYLSFTAGLPFERKKDMLKTLLLINFIRNKFKRAEMHIGVVEVEPSSPWYLYKKYGILSNRKSFVDFYNAHKNNSSLGYHTRFFSEKEIVAVRKLYLAETRCIHLKSYFLNQLEDEYFSIENFDIKTLHKFCKICERYNNCFED